MADYTLRPAVSADAVQIHDLIHLVGINPTGLAWKRFLVAVTPEGQVIACGQLKPHGADVLELASIATLPAYRKRGIATAIIQHLLAQSPRPLYLTCVSTMGSFYETFGFYALEYEEMPRYFQRLVKLAGLAFALSRQGKTLLVMKLK